MYEKLSPTQCVRPCIGTRGYYVPASMVKMKYYLVDPTSPGQRTVLLAIRKIVRLCVCLVDCLVWNHRRHLDGLNVKIQRLEVVHIWPFSSSAGTHVYALAQSQCAIRAPVLLKRRGPSHRCERISKPRIRPATPPDACLFLRHL